MPTEPKTVKSARRVFEVLEFFNDRRREATAKEIADALAFPQSSTSELLSSMVSLGYLNYSERLYRPSARVALLGSWILPSLFRSGQILDLMQEVAGKAAETVILATHIGLNVRYIHIIRASRPDAASLPTSSDRPLLRSSFGRLLLSTTPDGMLVDILDRLNDAEPDPAHRLSSAALTPVIEKIRSRGYALSVDTYQRGSGVLCMLLPLEDDREEQMAVGIAGTSQALIDNEDRFASILREAIDRHYPDRPRRVGALDTPAKGEIIV